MAKSSKQSKWFETSVEDFLEPGFKGKKLKLIADAQLQKPVISEIVSARIDVEVLPSSKANASDSEVLAFAEHRQRILLTLDADFWDDRKHPLHRLRTGIIYVAEPTNRHEQILEAFGLIYGCFAKEFPLDWWGHMKARTTVGEFELKIRNWESRVVRYRMRLGGGRLLALES